MGLLVDGNGKIAGTIPRPQVENSLEKTHSSAAVTPDGSAGPTGDAGFKAESGATISTSPTPAPGPIGPYFRELKELTEHIGVSAVHPDMLDQGWTFDV